MKRSSSSKSRPARLTEDSYEPADDEITTQKVKFSSLYEEYDADEAVAEEEDDDEEEQEEEKEAGYALRQKHKKIWKISSIKNGVNNQQQQQQHQLQEKFVCSKCGKGFQSLKAKCGHMACHSEKEKATSINFFGKQKLAMDDSLSDTESGARRLTRRSRRARYKKHNTVSVVGSKAKVDVYKNCSSEGSGVEQEQEQVAISLMLLSRDSANWGGLNSVGDSSDNNSVVLEARSISTKLAQKDGLSNGYQVDEASKKCAIKKVTSLCDSESLKVGNFRKSKFEEGSKKEPHLSLKKLKRALDAGLIREGEGCNPCKRSRTDLYLTKSALNEPYMTGYDAGNHYSSTEMHQRFVIHSQSHQAFNAGTENDKNFAAASPYESGENSSETDASLCTRKGKGILEHHLSNVGDRWKKGKHECPVCFKLFKSGQALGGHRRVHLSEGSDEIKSDEVSANFKRKGSHLHDLIDLNLPAPMEDDEASPWGVTAESKNSIRP